MPRIPRSEQTVGVSATQQPFSVGDAYAAPGKALAHVGEQLGSLATTLIRQDEELSMYEGQRAYQEFVGSEGTRRHEADTNLTGDGRGHVEREDQTTNQGFEDIRRRFADRPRVLNRLELLYGRDRQRWGARSLAAQTGRIGPYFTEQADEHFTRNIQPHLFRNLPDGHPLSGLPEESRLESVRRGGIMVDQWLAGASGLPESHRERIRLRLTERIYKQWRQRAGPEAAVEREEVVRLLQERVAGREGRLPGGDTFPADATDVPESVRRGDGRRTPPPGEQPPTTTGPGTDRPPPDTGTLEILPVPGNRTPRGSRTRESGVRIEGIVLHHTAGSTLESAISTNQDAFRGGTGYHYYIDRDGRVYRFSPDENRMVHIQDPGSRHRTAGAWDNLRNENTISISAVARNDADVTDVQRNAMRRLVAQLTRTHGIDARNIVGHGDIQSGPHGNREATEGTGLAREFREGRTGPPEVRIAQGPGTTRTDTTGTTAPPTAPPPPSLTEQRVWERIVGSAVEIENFARTERRRLELEENRETADDRRQVAREGAALLQNLHERRERDTRTPGVTSEPDPAQPELTQEWLDAHQHILPPGTYNTLLRGLNRSGRARISDSAVYSNLMRMSRDAGSHTEVVTDLANDAYASHLLTAPDRDRILNNVRGRRERPDVEAPPAVADAFRELHRRIGIPRRGAPAEELDRYNGAVTELNRYVTEQVRAGTLDPRALGAHVVQLADRFRNAGIETRMGPLRREPLPRFLRSSPDTATLDDVASAIFALRQDIDIMASAGAPTAVPQAELAREARYLQQLYAILVDRYRMQHNGQDPPPPRIAPPPPTPGEMFESGGDRRRREGEGFLGPQP